MAKILLVDDDEAMRDMLADILAAQRHVVEKAFDGPSAIDKVLIYNYDLVVVDWELPTISGLEVCTRIKNHCSSLPVLMLTAKTRVQDKEAGLQSGADDYLTKPFNPAEFAARVRALLRRSSAEQKQKLVYRDIALNPDTGQCVRRGRHFDLAKKEASLLELLILQQGNPLSTEALLSRLWGPDGSRAGLVNCLKRLRSKLNGAGEDDVIEALPGIGYQLKNQ